MSNDCQKEEVISNDTRSWGPGECEKEITIRDLDEIDQARDEYYNNKSKGLFEQVNHNGHW
jgi:hypothetical protein